MINRMRASSRMEARALMTSSSPRQRIIRETSTPYKSMHDFKIDHFGVKTILET